MKKISLWLFVALLCLHAAALAQGPAGQIDDAEEPQTENPFLLQNGILVNPDTDLMYIMVPEGGIEARQIQTGQKVWQTHQAAKPLTMRGNTLVAQAEGQPGSEHIDVLYIPTSPAAGAPKSVSLSISGASWNGVDDGLGKSLNIIGGEHQGNTIIWWQANEEVPRGAAVANMTPRSLAGSYLLSQEAGIVESLSNLPPAPAPQRLQLLPPTEQLSSQGTEYLSVNGDHILVSQRIADNGHWNKYRWTIYNRAGEEVGTTNSHFSTSFFHVSGQTLVYLAQPTLRRIGNSWEELDLRLSAIDLRTGEQIWQQPVRDTAYRGPFPM